MDIGRRDFLKGTAATAAAATLIGAAPAPVETREGMPMRRLGRTEVQVSLLCLGGAHIGLDSVSDEESIRIMRTAVDEGVNFFDNAWTYNGGRSEELMGKALKDGYRDKVFLMTKQMGRDAKAAQQQLEDSLRRMQVDVIDLWQMHQVVDPDEPRQIFDNGCLEVALKAQKEGKVRFIGFTGHHIPSTHLEMIARGFPWATVQMPINVFDWHYRSFAKRVIPEAQKNDIGIIAMKTLAGTPGAILDTGAATAAECLRFAMGQPVATVCSGMDTMEKLRHNIAVAKSFKPFTQEELDALLARTKPFAEDGAHEVYKTGWHKDIGERMQAAGKEVA